MSTSILKRRKIAKFTTGPAEGFQKSYAFVFSSDLTDWIYGATSTGVSKKIKHKQHEEEIRRVSESIEDSTPFYVKDSGAI